MSTKKPFIVKNGLAVNDTIVIGDNGKLHANNSIANGTITQSMLSPDIIIGGGGGGGSGGDTDFGSFASPAGFTFDYGSF
jgi:hypothetical protein